MTRTWLLPALLALAAASPIVAWTYTVKPGDTLATIAARMGVSVRALAAANRIDADDPIHAGLVLKRPDSDAPPPAPPRHTAHTAPRVQAPAAAAADPQAPHLAWPASGAVTVRFGSETRGHLARGIDLAAFAGMTVKAAAGGTVVFAGTEPERFGQLIVIDHGHGWTTAYAYLGKVLVSEHETVRAGAAIARIGKSGEAKKPTLHFELRHDNTPRDPLPVLPVRL